MHIIVSYDLNIVLIFLCKRWIPCQASTSVLCLHYRPESQETVHCSTKDAYTAEITFLALHPCPDTNVREQLGDCKVNVRFGDIFYFQKMFSRCCSMFSMLKYILLPGEDISLHYAFPFCSAIRTYMFSVVKKPRNHLNVMNGIYIKYHIHHIYIKYIYI